MAFFVVNVFPAAAQQLGQATTTQVASLSGALQQLQGEVLQLQQTVIETQKEAVQSRDEVARLHEELRQTRQQLVDMKAAMEHLQSQMPVTAGSVASPGQVPSLPAAQSSGRIGPRVSALEDEQKLLASELKDQYQTKVESASKYRMRISGIALLNVFGNRGSVDNLDVPNLAMPRGSLESSGSFGATMRQTQLGLEVYGPKLAGAQTSGSVKFDFFGGFPEIPNGTTMGLMRLRTATVRLDWAHSALVVGQDVPFFSPLSPTSIASLGVPAFAYSGNLWTWTPQIRFEHHVNLRGSSNLFLQAGILDGLSGEPYASAYGGVPQAGESSRQPAYGARVAWTRPIFGQSLTIGAGGYYSRQRWGFNRNVDAWAGTADWTIPFGRWFSLTGEFYRGRALGGLGGGIGRSVLFNGPLTDPATRVLGLNSIGGWTQLKFEPTERLEFNAAIGQDDSFARDLRFFSQAQSYLNPSLARNQTELFNVIYRPRSDLLLSLEYRPIRTATIYGEQQRAGQVNLGVGMLF